MSADPDHYMEGFHHAMEMRSIRDVRQHVIATAAASWPAEVRRGFLDGHAYLIRMETCTCIHCPQHGDNENPRAQEGN